MDRFSLGRRGPTVSVITPVFSFGLNGYARHGPRMTSRGAEKMIAHTIGIDISKDQLDAYRCGDGESRRFANTRTGHQDLIEWLGQTPFTIVAFEAARSFPSNGVTVQILTIDRRDRAKTPASASRQSDSRTLVAAARIVYAVAANDQASGPARRSRAGVSDG